MLHSLKNAKNSRFPLAEYVLKFYDNHAKQKPVIKMHFKFSRIETIIKFEEYVMRKEEKRADTMF